MQSLGISQDRLNKNHNSFDFYLENSNACSQQTFKITSSLSRGKLTLSSLFLIILFIGGCTQKEENHHELDKTLPPPPPPFALKGHLDDLTIPDQLLFIGGFNLLNQTTQRLADQLPNFLSTPFDLREQWLNSYVQTELMIESKLIHMERPLRILRFAVNKETSSVHLLGITDREALIKSSNRFEAQQHEGAEMYIYRRYQGDKKPTYFLFLQDDMVVVTSNLNLLSKAYLEFYHQLNHVSLSGLINARFFPKRLSLNTDDLTRQEQELNELALKGSNASIARQKGLLKAGLRWAHQVAQDSDQVELIVDLDQSRFIFDLDWSLNQTSLTYQQLQLLNGGEHPLIQELETAVALVSVHLPKELFIHLAREWNRYILTPPKVLPNALSTDSKSKKVKDLPRYLGQNSEAVADYLQNISQAAQHLNGDLVLAAELKEKTNTEKTNTEKTNTEKTNTRSQTNEKDATIQKMPNSESETSDPSVFLPPVQERSLAWVGMFQHTHQQQLRESLQATLNIYQDKDVKAALKKRGVQVQIKSIQSTELAGEMISIKSRMPKTPSFLKPLRPQVKELYDAHLWLGEKRGVVGFSNSWKETLQRHAQSHQNQSEKNSLPSQALKAGVTSPFLFLYLNPASIISALKRGRVGSILLPLQMMFAHTPNTEGIGLTIGKGEHGLKVRLTIARALLEAIRSSVSGVSTQTIPPQSL